MPSQDLMNKINEMQRDAKDMTADQCVTVEGYKAFVRDWRQALDCIGNGVRHLTTHPAIAQPADGVDPGEAKANIMLAYRHLEDARMRLGKAIQAVEGGVSIYDRPSERTMR